uniref:Gibberellin 20 oxidase 2-like n=3 Tax=Nicotiana TaxID=4085 RepID=A0A1S4A3Q8_TOBAC|nr:PREDICTED: gibberellin 20 oxidase 2-like [Nicotiana sylvestris]XP_016471245.1 PREDICTED: gibberellin 20 oxidase 2-like [Nicotiana tabacum]
MHFSMNTFQQQTKIPKEFIYPKEDQIQAEEELTEPVIDLGGFFIGNNSVATQQHVAMLVKAACLNHGFFQVINHGVDSQLINMAHSHVNSFFKLPLGVKLKARKERGNLWGYSSAHAERFCSKLPWKETLSFNFHENNNQSGIVVDFFESAYGKEFEEMGLVFERYCKAMKRVGLVIMEILGMSLGVEKSYYKEFFRDTSSIMRCNYYPTCQDPDLALGTAPHSDPNSLTILHQDQVGGLEVFVDSKWKSVRPRPDALVINIGDTFTALSNGIYKSCVHRAIVNRQHERISLAFFLSPKEDKVIIPPQHLISRNQPRMYPDFTWFDFLNFTQNHYRADHATLQNFTLSFLSSKPIDIAKNKT